MDRNGSSSYADLAGEQEAILIKLLPIHEVECGARSIVKWQKAFEVFESSLKMWLPAFCSY